MPFREWLKKLLTDAERQQEELRRLKARSQELLDEKPPERRKTALPVAIDRRRRPFEGR